MKRNGESHPFSNTEGIIGGVIFGAVIAAAAAAIISSKSGGRLKEDVSEFYDQITDQVRGFTGRRPQRSSKKLNLIIGGIAGGVLGLSAIAWLASDSAKGVRNNLAHNFKYLSDKTSEIVEDLSEAAEETVENLEEHVSPWIGVAQEFVEAFNATKSRHRKKNHSTLDTVVDWAGLGLRLLQGIKK